VRRRWIALFVATAALVLRSGTVVAEPEEDSDPLISVRGSDPLEMARRVQRMGDSAVLTRLQKDRSVAVQLAAIRGARWMRAPESALGRLATLASGRDPDLAPAAVRACWRIARRLDPVALQRREVNLAALRPARQRLAALAEDASARGDIRRMAAFAADALTAVGVSNPKAKSTKSAQSAQSNGAQ
jgi:hypothetical protein